MASANCKITAELISDYAAGRLDVEDVQVMEEAINHDEDVAAAVAAARRVDARMTTALAASKLRRAKPEIGIIPCRPQRISPTKGSRIDARRYPDRLPVPV